MPLRMRHDSTIGGKAPDYSRQNSLPVSIEPLKPTTGYEREFEGSHIEWSDHFHNKYQYNWDQNDSMTTPPESPTVNLTPRKPWSFFSRQRPRTPSPEDEPNRQMVGMLWKPIARRASYGSTESTSDLPSDRESLASSPVEDSFLTSPPRSRSSSLSSKLSSFFDAASQVTMW